MRRRGSSRFGGTNATEGARMSRGADKLVRPSTLDRAFTPGTLNDGSSTSYGFGWGVGPGSVSHAGAWLGFRTVIFRSLRRSFTVVVLANCAELNAEALSDDIARIYLR
jgi:hypothetical protein